MTRIIRMIVPMLIVASRVSDKGQIGLHAKVPRRRKGRHRRVGSICSLLASLVPVGSAFLTAAFTQPLLGIRCVHQNARRLMRSPEEPGCGQRGNCQRHIHTCHETYVTVHDAQVFSMKNSPELERVRKLVPISAHERSLTNGVWRFPRHESQICA